jgi:alpha-L-fucosidase
VTKTALALVGALLLPSGLLARENPRVYRADWASLEQAEPAPEWFKDAKFGIYFHWGVYSVPAFGNEWYPRNMYFAGSSENLHHVATYGDVSVWPYPAFATGAKDRQGRFVQFAPKLKSEGGNFDPEEWAQLFADAGARFAGPVAEHHDGFSMWASKVNPWNAKDMGPRLDLVGLLTDAIRRRGMKTLVSMHHAYNITGFYEAAPKTDDPKLKMLYGQQSREANEALWLAKHKEVIDNYRPDIIWQDFNLHRLSEPVLLQFLAYYYNRAAEWGKEVVATYKDGLNPRCAVLDYERGGPSDIRADYWLTDDAISATSWSYTEGIRYYSQKQVLHGFIDRISKNGNLLLNISPQADGTIPREQKDLLLAMGAWLRKYGEAVYATRAWERYGEGPTRMGAAHGVMGPPSEGTARDVRYTRSKDNSTLYAILLGWETGQEGITLESLSSDRIDGSRLRSVALINGQAGAYLPLAFEQRTDGLHVHLPRRTLDELAYVIRLTFEGGIPDYDNFAAFDGAAHYHLLPGDGSGDLVLGSELSLTRQRKAAANQWRLESVGHGVYRLLDRADSTLALTSSSDRHGVTLSAVSEDAGQYWRITNVPGGAVSISDSRDPSVALWLPAGATAGTRAGLAQAGTPSSSSQWRLIAVCEQKQVPFKAHVLPGTVEAEDYDVGCPGDAYHDRDDVNEGGLYRLGQGVDIGECSAGGYTLGWTHAGEWTAYTVSIAKPGRYRAAFHVASAMDGAAIHLESDGVDLTGRIDIPNTKGFQNWAVVERIVELSAGEHVLKVHIDGDYVNLDKIVFEMTE